MRWVTSFTDPWLSFSEFGPVGRQPKGMHAAWLLRIAGGATQRQQITLTGSRWSRLFSFFFFSPPSLPSSSQVTAALLSR